MAKAWKSPLRLYLTGRLAAELGDARFDERRLPGRQGRRAFVYLHHHGGATCTESDPHCAVCPLLVDCAYGKSRASRSA